MTANKAMTGEQLDELMTVAVNMQRDAETDCNRPYAMFAYAVQVAVLELRNVRNDAVVLEQKLAESQREFRAADATIENLQMQVEKLAAERDIVNADNAYLRDQVVCWARECDRITFTHTNKIIDAHQIEAEHELANTIPSTDAFLAEVRAQGVEMFAAHKRERQQALRSRSMRLSEEAAGMAADAEDFADHIRKGVQS
ncbi:hypothetical protein ISN40_10250 [Enterobacter asburiae]|uniref:hypothetical protein n=1 Tax=Enterobacter asburiae TaxID=61645 RepID=UPI001888C3D5|nr:hypothetical protein [Enterobacter asburiae]MBF2790591.1 hypothetical protein [Enterobacter asburiae]